MWQSFNKNLKDILSLLFFLRLGYSFSAVIAKYCFGHKIIFEFYTPFLCTNLENPEVALGWSIGLLFAAFVKCIFDKYNN